MKTWADEYKSGGGELAWALVHNVADSNPGIKWGDVNPDDHDGRTVFGGVMDFLCGGITMDKLGADISAGFEKLLKKFASKHGVGLLEQSTEARRSGKLNGTVVTEGNCALVRTAGDLVAVMSHPIIRSRKLTGSGYNPIGKGRRGICLGQLKLVCFFFLIGNGNRACSKTSCGLGQC